MSQPARSFVVALALVSGLAGCPSPAPQLPAPGLAAPGLAASSPPDSSWPDEVYVPLTAVARRERVVLASTPAGLFRAPLATRRWERLETPREMPLDGTFAAQPGRSPVVIYVARRPAQDRGRRDDLRYGLYLTPDDGATWELIAERDDFGAILLHPAGPLFAVTGGVVFYRDEQHLLRSPDLGRTWRDISNGMIGAIMGLEPDPDHPGLVRVHSWALRDYTLTAVDEGYRWNTARDRGNSGDFFGRGASSTTAYYIYQATLANYFRSSFGNQTQMHALEVVPGGDRFEFARGARVAVPVRVVLHHDQNAALNDWWTSGAAGRGVPRPTPPAVRFVDRPGRLDFWGVRVESAAGRDRSFGTNPDAETKSFESFSDGKLTTSGPPPRAVPYRVFDLAPDSPYEREIDLGPLHDFSRPGEYRVQIIYNSGRSPDREKGDWDGSFTSPAFTVVIRE